MTALMRSLLALGLLLLTADLAAHAIGVSQGRYVIDGESLQVEIGMARGELLVALPTLDTDADGELAADELEAGHSDVLDALGTGVIVQRDGRACRHAPAAAALSEADGVTLSLRYTCDAAQGTWQALWPWLDRLTLGHRHLATVVGTHGHSQFVLHAGDAQWQLDAGDATTDRGFLGMVAYGVEHILTGYDHLLFVLGLMLLGGRRRDLFYTVTAFTAAHSVTLAAASLQWYAPSADLVEPLIALTIAWVGIENWMKVDASRRWRLSLVFGLVHGFGFAGALGEAAIPAERIPSSLLAFNLGVEAGQLAVLALALPALYGLRRLRFASQGVYALNGAIVLAGLGWFVQRVAF